ncbi:3-hydroxyisobutyryl-CoA hydrolase like protein [Verticillium longisporum]|uniref:3-hydroxyisobutyryl-CoA hydrolase n=1 Tax=Verticillium longisporum TaxID=100787 RepID=A0A8I2ZDP7_VERLO|nr:3-hydroxyisobutyryl-CoA hydrolase like protein [Verticillium longisporum]
MPLRAKINNVGGARAQMSTRIRPEDFKPLSEDDPDDVVFNSAFGVRSIELNRPKKLNSLNASMIRKIVPRLSEWEKSDMVNVILMKGAGEKAFCAGGDVTALAQYNQEGPDGWKTSAAYFELEYKLNHYISTYTKPYVAIMDGITMGGGVGLSIHAPFRIATERTVFAMPETTIGFFPDVGASFFLPRMNGGIGTYLALTSDRLKGVNAFYSGIATHYLDSTTLPLVEARLSELRFKDYDSLAHRLAVINSTIEEYTTGLPYGEPILLAGELRRAIDRCFTKDSVPEILKALEAEEGATKAWAQKTLETLHKRSPTILKALEAEEGATKAWAQKTLETLHKRSPTAVHVTLRQMRVGRDWSIAKTFQREHQIAAQFMQHPDFTEGVSALLMSKGNPREPAWQPATLEQAAAAGDVAEPFFRYDEGQALELLNDESFDEYPHEFGLPKEDLIEAVVERGNLTPKEVVEEFIDRAVTTNSKGIARIAGKKGAKAAKA